MQPSARYALAMRDSARICTLLNGAVAESPEISSDVMAWRLPLIGTDRVVFLWESATGTKEEGN